MEKKTCCICGRVFEGWGNNPWPIKDEGECCDVCNKKVVAYRIIRHLRQEGISY